MERRVHVGRYQPVDGATQTGDFLDNARTEKGISILGHHEDGFDLFLEPTVHQSQLKFKFEVGDGSESPDNRLTLLLGDVVNQEPLELVDLDVGDVAGGLVFGSALGAIVKRIAPLA